MVPPIDPHAFLSLVELTLAQTYELEAIGKLLEEKGLLTRADIRAKATVLKAAAELGPATDRLSSPSTEQNLPPTTH